MEKTFAYALVLAMDCWWASFCVASAQGNAGSPGETNATSKAVANDDHIRQVNDNWKQRAARMRSFELEWTEVRILASRSALGPEDEGQVEANHESSNSVPWKETRQTHRCRLVIDGERMRFEGNGPQHEPILGFGTFVQRNDIAISDGIVSKAFRGYEEVGATYPYPQGRIYAGGKNYYANDLSLWAVWVSMRPLDPYFCPSDLVNYRWTGTSSEVDGLQCNVLERFLESGHRELLWVHPDAEYAVVQYSRFSNADVLEARYRVFYDTESNPRWLPLRWVLLVCRPSDGALVESRDCSVSYCTVGQSIGSDVFSLEFPEGTWVRDRRDNTQYIQRDNGNIRRIVPGEKGKYHDFLTSATGERLVVSDRPGYRWILTWSLPLTVVLVVFLIVILIRKERRIEL